MTLYSSLRTVEPQLSVLLIFTPAILVQESEPDRLVEKARSVLDATVQIMRVSDATHPEVSRSFGFTSLPALVLLQRGLEVWRYSGPVDSTEPFRQLGSQIRQNSPKHCTNQIV